jgi:hypothetical protein
MQTRTSGSVRKTRSFLRILTSLAVAAVATTGLASANGTASYSAPISWSSTGDLYFNVNGGPASTCGSLVISRNGGSYQTTAGWLCTDGSGNAAKGPWSWAGQPSDETSIAYILWPDSSSTNSATHVWDKTKPTAAITAAWGAPPSAFSGTGSDGAHGACFSSSWTPANSYATFHDLTTDRFWTPSAGAYSGQKVCHPVGGACIVPKVSLTLTGMPGCSIGWSSAAPGPLLHTSGDNYEWTVCVYDGGQFGCTSGTFTG